MRADLSFARQALVSAEYAPDPVQRYTAAQTAALRTATVVLALRCAPTTRRRPVGAWQLLTRCAPELAEWAGYFDLGQRRVAQWRRTERPVVGIRTADDHLRDAQAFYTEVAGWLRRHPEPARATGVGA